MKPKFELLHPAAIYFCVRISKIAFTRAERDTVFPVTILLNQYFVYPMRIEFNIKITNFRLKEIDHIVRFFYLFFVNYFVDVTANINR